MGRCHFARVRVRCADARASLKTASPTASLAHGQKTERRKRASYLRCPATDPLSNPGRALFALMRTDSRAPEEAFAASA